MSRMLKRLRMRLKAHFSRYEGIAKEVYEDALETPEVTIRDIYKIIKVNSYTPIAIRSRSTHTWPMRF
jgi:hypothetical protein